MKHGNNIEQRGRPRNPDRGAKVFGVSVNALTQSAIERAIARSGMPQGEWLRRALLNAALAELEEGETENCINFGADND